MRVFNLTNVETEKLKRYRMLNHTIPVGGQLVEPGASVEVEPEEEPLVRAHLEHFLEVGAVSIDQPPESPEPPPLKPTVPLPLRRSKPSSQPPRE